LRRRFKRAGSLDETATVLNKISTKDAREASFGLAIAGSSEPRLEPALLSTSCMKRVQPLHRLLHSIMKGKTHNSTLRSGTVTLAERAREVKAQCPIEEVVAHYREVKPSGTARFVCRCLCGRNTDRRPSFTLYKRDNGFHCFACGAHGSVIDLVMLAEGCDFRTALLRLEADLGSAAPLRLTPNIMQRDEPKPLSLLDQRILNAATDCYHTQLLRNMKTMHYLTEQRGLSLETICKLKIGYSDNRTLIRHIYVAGLSVTRLLKLGLVTAQYEELLRQRVIFPILRGTNAVYMLGRATEKWQEAIKYLNLPDGVTHKQPMVLGTPRLGSIWVEGPFDVAALVQWDLDADYLLVGLLGTAHADALAVVRERALGCTVFVAMDQDAAGDRAAEAILRDLVEQDVCAVRVQWTGAKDCGGLGEQGWVGRAIFLSALDGSTAE
jgi:DNA primase